MDNSTIAALWELLAKATPGDWEYTPVDRDNERVKDRISSWFATVCEDVSNPDDAALITAAVNALPALLTRIEELEREREGDNRRILRLIKDADEEKERADNAESRAADLTEALRPFAKIVPSSLYDASGSEGEDYCVLLAPQHGNPPEFTGADLARARSLIEDTQNGVR